MATITAAAVKSLRERTGLPMMDCKKALQQCDGNEDTAIEHLRKQGLKTFEKRSDRSTEFGRFGMHPFAAAGEAKLASPGAMVELKCESAPVTQNAEFIQLANDLATTLANNPDATTADALLDLPSPTKGSMTLREQKDDLFNRIREIFNVGRMVRVDGTCGSYSHNASTVAGVLVEIEGDDAEVAKDVCQHIAAMSPQALQTDDLSADEVAKERAILTEAARSEGKPEKIIEKMVDGRMRNFYAESVLLEQAFVKDDKQTVGKFAKAAGVRVKGFTHWVLGEG